MTGVVKKLQELDDEVEGLIDDTYFVAGYFAVIRTNDRRGGRKKVELVYLSHCYVAWFFQFIP